MRNLIKVSNYYTKKFEKYGDSHLSADWSSKKVQNLRFKLLSKLLKKKNKKLLEIGCGTGDFINFIKKKKYVFFSYTGIDISKKIIFFSKKKFKKSNNVSFYNSDKFKISKDYIIANGIFNVKLSIKKKEWERYFFKTITEMNNFSKEGFAFNFLPELKNNKKKKKYLFYIEKEKVIKFCEKFSNKISIIKNRNIIDLTMIVEK